MTKNPAGAPGDLPQSRPRRKKVILADSRAPVTVLRTVVELEEQTSWAEEVVRSFIRIQFWTSVRLALVIGVAFGALPLVFYLVPDMSDVRVAGVSLPWLLLGVLPFPLLFGVGYWYNVLAEGHERDFVDMVEK
ncbi:hypothetical protein V5P93_000080 [Actinokineospora auranticolor]|uniref:DUF485 domain-containing protein n=1 Tax=Actinokineospora auranticolor TaxID=155976 RepID=A0A2S6GBV7_9PSEU|nr:hypothetical protein [Actinokineospora auranticolor]PPK61760.1 hypothetical protein CLV40_13957 [Actinokineospora auranticolor]